MENYLERIELPDGQWATLLTRLPTDRAQTIRVAVARESQARGGRGIRRGDPVFIEAVTKALLWEASLKDYLTNEPLDASEYGRADPRVTDTLQAHAFVLYVKWDDEAYPSPKESGRTDESTPDGSPPSETPEKS